MATISEELISRTPVVKEVRAVRTLRKKGGSVNTAALKIICTTVIAISVCSLCGVSFFLTREIPPGLQTSLGLVLAYYFVQRQDEPTPVRRSRKESDE